MWNSRLLRAGGNCFYLTSKFTKLYVYSAFSLYCTFSIQIKRGYIILGCYVYDMIIINLDFYNYKFRDHKIMLSKTLSFLGNKFQVYRLIILLLGWNDRYASDVFWHWILIESPVIICQPSDIKIIPFSFHPFIIPHVLLTFSLYSFGYASHHSLVSKSLFPPE